LLNGTGTRKDHWRLGNRNIIDIDGDPREAMQFVEPPNTSGNILRTFQIVTAMIQSMGGSGSIAEGQPGRNMPRAGFAVHDIINLGMADIQDVAEVLEQEILTPGLGDIYKVAALFIPEAQKMRIPGGQAFYDGLDRASTVIGVQDILGEYEFEWVGSLQFQNGSERAQQLMMFSNLLMQMTPVLQQQGVAVNWKELIPMIWRYGLGERGLSKVLVDMPPQPMPQQPGMGGPGMPPSGTNGASAPSAPPQGVNGLNIPIPQPSIRGR